MNIRTLAIKYCEFLDRKSRTFHVVAGVACAALLGAADCYSDRYFGVDYSLALFYLLPVAFVAWFAGRIPAIAMAMICIVTKLAIQSNMVETLSLLLWKNGSALAFYLVVGMLLAKMRELLEHERAQSRIDSLTGAANRRGFLDATTREVYRLRRYGHPFAIAYLDLDNFKEINDDHGHDKGDFLLQKVASTIAHNLRGSDVVARLGGDEFTVLLANADENAARVAMRKIREQLQESMRRHKLPVTFSIGVLTCAVAPSNAEEVINLADRLMYEVKRSGKDDVRHAGYVRCDLPESGEDSAAAL